MARAELQLEALPDLKNEIHACREAAEVSSNALAQERQKAATLAAELAAERKALEKAEAQLDKLAGKLDASDTERRAQADQISSLKVAVAKLEATKPEKAKKPGTSAEA